MFAPETVGLHGSDRARAGAGSVARPLPARRTSMPDCEMTR